MQTVEEPYFLLNRNTVSSDIFYMLPLDIYVVSVDDSNCQNWGRSSEARLALGGRVAMLASEERTKPISVTDTGLVILSRYETHCDTFGRIHPGENLLCRARCFNGGYAIEGACDASHPDTDIRDPSSRLRL